MIRQSRSRRFAEGMATPSAIEDNWQNETGLLVTLKGAQLGQIAHLCEAIELRGRSTKRIHLGVHRL
jgi:23S rRNA pseudouridine2604 synthase